MRTRISKRHPNLQYKISYRFAELANSQGDANESLTYLKQAITYAEDYEKLNKDPLLLMPAETYLNSAIAYQFSQNHKEALDAAQKADEASKKSIIALN